MKLLEKFAAVEVKAGNRITEADQQFMTDYLGTMGGSL